MSAMSGGWGFHEGRSHQPRPKPPEDLKARTPALTHAQLLPARSRRAKRRDRINELERALGLPETQWEEGP